VVPKIASQSTAPTTQISADALFRNESQDNSLATSTVDKTKPLGASYELTLSEKAKSLFDSTPPINNSADAQKHLVLIKAAAQQSAATVLNLQNPNVKSAIDLLA